MFLLSLLLVWAMEDDPSCGLWRGMVRPIWRAHFRLLLKSINICVCVQAARGGSLPQKVSLCVQRVSAVWRQRDRGGVFL